jgi:hypothetical protein
MDGAVIDQSILERIANRSICGVFEPDSTVCNFLRRVGLCADNN